MLVQVQLISHLLSRHGSDWEAMARDPRNHYQETAAKLRGMVNKFISIPEHYAVYCKERGLMQPAETPGGTQQEGEEEAEDDMEDQEEDLYIIPNTDSEEDVEEEDD
jgi:hypothetical protein